MKNMSKTHGCQTKVMNFYDNHLPSVHVTILNETYDKLQAFIQITFLIFHIRCKHSHAICIMIILNDFYLDVISTHTYSPDRTNQDRIAMFNAILCGKKGFPILFSMLEFGLDGETDVTLGKSLAITCLIPPAGFIKPPQGQIDGVKQ